MALPKPNRLRHWRDFQTIYQKGSRCNGYCLTLRALRYPVIEAPFPNEEMPTCIGVSISQKVSKKATIRNRIKRQIHGAFWRLMPQIAPGWQLVVLVRPTALECDFSHFLRELEQLLRESEAIDGHSGRNLL